MRFVRDVRTVWRMDAARGFSAETAEESGWRAVDRSEGGGVQRVVSVDRGSRPFHLAARVAFLRCKPASMPGRLDGFMGIDRKAVARSASSLSNETNC